VARTASTSVLEELVKEKAMWSLRHKNQKTFVIRRKTIV
jgi:hypothetical protein